MQPMDMIDNIIIPIQPYHNKKIDVCEIPYLVGIYSKTLCDKSNHLHMFDLDNIIKMISFIMDVLVCNKILVVNGNICYEQTRKLVINCTSLLNKSIEEKITPKTISEQFASTYIDFIKAITEPLIP
jgi:hypothetical protein